jgi:hypothetical protein
MVPLQELVKDDPVEKAAETNPCHDAGRHQRAALSLSHDQTLLSPPRLQWSSISGLSCDREKISVRCGDQEDVLPRLVAGYRGLA